MWLAKGLCELGHDVSVAAFAGSLLPRGARLIEVERNEVSLSQFLPKIPRDTELIHCMAPPSASEIASLPIPYLVTIHGNGKPGEVFPKNTVFLSKNHAIRHGSARFVYNGLDPSEYDCIPKSERKHRLAFLAKTSWSVKNVRGAISVAARAQVPLWIGGGAGPIDARLRVLMKSFSGWKWLGSIGGQEKRDLLAQSRGFLFPVIWEEPFGLAVVEALLSGLPVIASQRGSLPELLFQKELGRCVLGSPVENPEAWHDAVQAVLGDSAYDPQEIRSLASQRFHYLKMAESYLALYKEIL